MKVVLERIGRKEDDGNAAFLTDAYATTAIACHRAAGVYIVMELRLMRHVLEGLKKRRLKLKGDILNCSSVSLNLAQISHFRAITVLVPVGRRGIPPDFECHSGDWDTWELKSASRE